MVLSTHRRPWRALVLVLTGMLAGAALVAPGVAGLAAQAPAVSVMQTRTASCQGLNFHPIGDSTSWGYNGSMIFRYDVGGPPLDYDGFFVCDPGLPNKAVVTKVQFTVNDPSTDGQVRYCALYRAGLTVPLAAQPGQVVADAGDTGMASQPGIVRLTTRAISHGTIDNASWGYYLQCQINFPLFGSTTLVGIYGATVTYRISSANG